MDENDPEKMGFVLRGCTLMVENRLEEAIEDLRKLMDQGTPEGVARFITVRAVCFLGPTEIQGWKFDIKRFREYRSEQDPLCHVVVLGIISPPECKSIDYYALKYGFDPDYMAMGEKGFLNFLGDILRGEICTSGR